MICGSFGFDLRANFRLIYVRFAIKEFVGSEGVVTPLRATRWRVTIPSTALGLDVCDRVEVLV